jgi:hypothetical protein
MADLFLLAASGTLGFMAKKYPTSGVLSERPYDVVRRRIDEAARMLLRRSGGSDLAAAYLAELRDSRTSGTEQSWRFHKLETVQRMMQDHGDLVLYVVPPKLDERQPVIAEAVLGTASMFDRGVNGREDLISNGVTLGAYIQGKVSGVAAHLKLTDLGNPGSRGL